MTTNSARTATSQNMSQGSFIPGYTAALVYCSFRREESCLEMEVLDWSRVALGGYYGNILAWCREVLASVDVEIVA